MNDKTAKRRATALALRKDGATFAEIGAALGVGSARAQQIYARACFVQCDDEDTIKALSCRTWNCLTNYGLPSEATRDDVRAVIDALRHGATKAPGIKNFGRKSLAEVEEWLAK